MVYFIFRKIFPSTFGVNTTGLWKHPVLSYLYVLNFEQLSRKRAMYELLSRNLIKIMLSRLIDLCDDSLILLKGFIIKNQPFSKNVLLLYRPINSDMIVRFRDDCMSAN